MAQSLERDLDYIQKESFKFFARECNRKNGLVLDKNERGAPCSIAATGFAAACYVAAVERGCMRRTEALQRCLATVRFFLNSDEQTGHHGFYFHFLDIKNGRRMWRSELSTVDSGLLILGLMTAAQYFDSNSAKERELREGVAELYDRMDWPWACNGGLTLTHGHRPERGFLKFRWQGYNEGLFLYLLALGASRPLKAASYKAWCSTYEWTEIYGHKLLSAGPLFAHQFPHLWIDFRGMPDAFMCGKGIDYFENSRRATYVQQKYCIENPRGFVDYSASHWGLTASDGPGPAVRSVGGRKRRFYGYKARCVPHGPDDGTLSPWAAITSLPFAPEIVLPTIEQFFQRGINKYAKYGFAASFNPSFKCPHPSKHWESPCNFGINQGPLILMVENYRTGLIWKLMRECKPLLRGLKRAGFSGGWVK